MIGSLRALALLAIVAIAAVVLAIVVPVPQIVTVDRRIAPGFDAASVRTLRWAHGGVVDTEITRTGDAWASKDHPVDAAAVDEVIAALRGGVWQRREPSARAGKLHARVLAIGSTTAGFEIGEPLAGTDQVWIVAGEDALLVDGWIARALDRTSLSLRVREPFARIAEAEYIGLLDIVTFKRTQLSGHPRRLDGVLVDAALVHRIEAALAAVKLVGEAEKPRPGGEYNTAFEIGPPVNAQVTDYGAASCGELLGSLGCVTWNGVGALVMELRKPIAEIAERRPAPIDPVAIRLVDGTLDLAKRPSIDGHDADPDRVAELVAALATRADVVTLPATKPTATIAIRDRAGQTIELELHDGIAVRRGESLGLRLAPAAWAALTRPAASYRDTALWLEEPTAIIAITVDRVTFKSGNIVGTWTREPAGTVDAPSLDAATRTLASPRAPAAKLPAGFAPQHTISILVATPSGPAITHVLEIGAGCVAKADGTAVTLPAPVCALAKLGT